ncbi:hypothetical protein K439DRAFT_1623113 [Ramaria rubella]|nr:hypothetical protein K439DRAFT_1623113 [Ramaria rubella]
MADFAENVAALVCDMGKQLSLTLGTLADVRQKAKELQDLQAWENVSMIMSTVAPFSLEPQPIDFTAGLFIMSLAASDILAPIDNTTKSALTNPSDTSHTGPLSTPGDPQQVP